MIGQQNILQKVDNLIKGGFPRFLIITGTKGQGKKVLANEIATRLHYPIITSGIKIDEIRDILDLAYKQTEPIIYLIPDADNMSLGAKNSLLKVIEEPPQQAYFIMTLQQIQNTLSTIKSRCIQLEMEEYTISNLNKFTEQIDVNNTLSITDKTILQENCSNKYELELFIRYGVQDFYNYCEKVVDNIYKVQSANSLKITQKLDIKEDDITKYNVKLFLNTFRNICFKRLLQLQDIEDNYYFNCYGQIITKTSNVIQKLSINGINKQSLLDIWILDIRKIWKEN